MAGRRKGTGRGRASDGSSGRAGERKRAPARDEADERKDAPASDAETAEASVAPGVEAEGSGAVVSEKRYYRIGEVAKITGVKAYVLRYWESEFRWMAPAKSRSKQRLYRKRDIEIIQLIKRLLYEERYTIAGARRKLQDLGVSRALDASQLEMALDADPRHQIRRIRQALEEVRATLA